MRKRDKPKPSAELIVHPSARLTPRLLLLSALQDVDNLESIVLSFKTKGQTIMVVDSDMKNSDLCTHAVAVMTHAQDSLF